MSTYFSKLIKAGEHVREFNFKLASSKDDTCYVVDVPDDKGTRMVFNAYRNPNGEWKVDAQTMPQWIHEAEPALGEAIEENRSRESWSRK